MKKILSIIITGLIVFNVCADTFKQRIAKRIPKNISKQSWVELREIHKAYSNETGEAWDPQNANTEYFVANLMRKYYKNKIKKLQADNRELQIIKKANNNKIKKLTDEKNNLLEQIKKLNEQVSKLQQPINTPRKSEVIEHKKTEQKDENISQPAPQEEEYKPEKSKTDILITILFVFMGIIFCFMLFNQFRLSSEKAGNKNLKDQ